MIAIGGCKMELNTGLDERTANEMLSKLLAHDISASKKVGKDEKITLLVDEAQFSEAVELLSALGLPREQHVSMGDVFAEGGLVSSPTQEQARMNFAQTQELAGTISSLPGIISAKVHIASTIKDGPFDEVSPSASVLVVIEENARRSDLIPKIKELVAFSVEGMAYDNVAVVVSSVALPTRPDIEFVGMAGVRLPKSSMSAAIGLLAVAGLVSGALSAVATFFAMRFLGKKQQANGG